MHHGESPISRRQNHGDEFDYVAPDQVLTGRISHRTRAWFNDPGHRAPGAWSAAVLSLSRCRVEGHVEAEGLELAEVVCGSCGRSPRTRRSCTRRSSLPNFAVL
jgi:hypothetical protein